MAPAVVAGRVHQLLDLALRQLVTRAGRAGLKNLNETISGVSA